MGVVIAIWPDYERIRIPRKGPFQMIDTSYTLERVWWKGAGEATWKYQKYWWLMMSKLTRTLSRGCWKVGMMSGFPAALRSA